MIVAGFAWHLPGDPPLAPTREVVIVGQGDRAHIDALAAAARDCDRAAVIEFFKPFVEGDRPRRSGIYIYSMREGAGTGLSHLWWKPVTKVL